MKIAYWSPLPPSSSGIADYSAELLPYLATRASVHLLVESEAALAPQLEAFPRHRARDAEAVDARERFDLHVYQIGNNADHRFVLNAALVKPGVVVLHDLVLQHLFLGVSVERGNVELYVSEMKRAYGERGAALGALLIAVVEVAAARFVSPSVAELMLYGLLVLVLLVRPRGLFGEAAGRRA